MNEDIKGLWLDALESGKFQKGTTVLAITDEATGDSKYCCLGVLCEIAVANGVIPEAQVLDSPGIQHGPLHQYAGNISLLPTEVVKWAELEGTNPRCAEKIDPISGKRMTLSYLNDRTFGFSEVIEEIRKL